MSRRYIGRLKKLESKKKVWMFHWVTIKPGETKEEALEKYKKRREIKPGDKIFITTLELN